MQKPSEPMKDTNMKCPNCGGDHWENVDNFRLKPAGMGLCTSCGFVSYPAKWKTKEEIFAHYRTSYRNPPTHANLFACERKNHFHHKFLAETFEAWKKEKNEAPAICEVGAAFGASLNFFRQVFPKADVSGTELTTSMRRNAAHEFGIKLSEDIDESKTYDMIMSYKVLEHQVDPHLELERYARLLKPGGLLYMSVPTWFKTLYNFGMSGFDLEYYFDPNHINVWTREVFESMLNRAGFEIVKADQVIYSSTYLCRVNPEMKKGPMVKHDPTVIKVALGNIKAAFLAFQENNFKKAIEIWPDYPQAHVSHAEMSRKILGEKGWAEFSAQIIEPALKACPESSDILVMATDFAMRAGELQAATKFAEKALLWKPENPVSLSHLVNIMRELALKAKDPKEKLHYFIQAREIASHWRHVSGQHFKEATDLILFFNSKIPFAGENETAPKERNVTSDSVFPPSRRPRPEGQAPSAALST